MATWGTRHPKREQTFPIRSFQDGLNQDLSAQFLPVTALTKCMNMKYVMSQTGDGNSVVALKIRQGTEKISTSALPSAADVQACTYYIAQAKYILATASKLYYLNSSGVPVEIGDIEGIPTFTEFHGKLIIHDGGHTKAWNGTTFEHLNDFITDELLATAGGVLTEFSGTLGHVPVEPSTITIDYTDTTAKAITDDGNGRLTGDVATGMEQVITGASNGNPCVITLAAHGYSTGDVISIQDVEGMTELNNRSFVITDSGGGAFLLDGVNSLGYAPYTTGGTASSNAIRYSDGKYTFTCSGAPDSTTTVTATYENDEGAPKSKAGLVRASRLYTWGDPDNPSRLSYTAPNDEDAWDSSSSGGDLDVNPLDGYSLISVLNFFQSLLIFKESGAYRLDNFPGDTTFRVEPLIQEISCNAYLATLNEGNIISFVSDDGWMAMAPSEKYGDIQKTEVLSHAFSGLAKKYANANAVSEYNQQDNQFWINLHNGTDYLNYIHVINMDTGGQLSQYKFAFGHSCFKYVNGEMLIGGTDGNLYRLLKSGTRFRDNAVSYSADTYIQGTMTNFLVPKNRKHNKYINVFIDGGCGAEATLNIYTNNDFDTVIYTTTIPVPMGNILAYDMSGVYAYDLTTPVFEGRLETIHKKFNYHELMFELTNINGSLGAQFNGFDFSGAVIGD
jgi:hypothetical protein